MQNKDWFICANCGTQLPYSAKICSNCGADEESGMVNTETPYNTNDDFDYDEFIQNEFGDQPKVKPRKMSWLTWTAIIALIIAFILYWIIP